MVAFNHRTIDFTTFPHVIACGTKTIGSVTAYSSSTSSVTIPTQPDTDYYVVATFNGATSYYAACQIAITNVSTTGFKINVYNDGANASGNIATYYIVVRSS